MQKRIIHMFHPLTLTYNELKTAKSALALAINARYTALEREKKPDYIIQLKKDFYAVKRALKKVDSYISEERADKYSLKLSCLECEQLLYGLFLFKEVYSKKLCVPANSIIDTINWVCVFA